MSSGIGPFASPDNPGAPFFHFPTFAHATHIMTTAQIQLVKKSWRLLRAVPPAVVADAFYSKLFLDHPELRRMFPRNMDEQYQKLVDMLSSMVARLDDLGSLKSEIVEMGLRHTGYGVKPKHYQMVGAALLWTLERGLGNDWTPETAAAWTQCYGSIADAMLSPE